MKEYVVKEAACCMRYQDLPGEEIPILFVHGLGCAGTFDYPLVAAQPALAGHRRILVDLLGAGYSDKPEDFDYRAESHARYLKTFVEELGIATFVLYGHSMGGAVAIELARLCPDSIGQLILNEANLDPSTEGTGTYRIGQFSEKEYLENGYHALLKEYQDTGNTRWAAAFQSWLPLAAHRFSRCAVEGGNPSWREILYSLPMHKSYIMGEHSMAYLDAEELRAHDIWVEVVPNAGHFMAWEQPEALAAALLACLGKKAANCQSQF